MTMSNHVDDIVQSPTTNKGKGKVHDNNSSNSEFSSENVYPPTGIELEETRRVEEVQTGLSIFGFPYAHIHV